MTRTRRLAAAYIALAAAVAVLFALPGFLYILDGVIGKTTLKSHFLPKDANAPAATQLMVSRAEDFPPPL